MAVSLDEDAAQLTTAEVVAVAVVTILASIVVIAYGLDFWIHHIPPVAVLISSLGVGAAVFIGLLRGSVWRRAELIACLSTVAMVLAWLFWLAWPSLLPLGGGPDLVHHLTLIQYIEDHRQLVHDTRFGAILGEMANYTPGSHLIVALAAAWFRTDGLHLLHPVVAVSVAIKTGFLFLIVLRLVPSEMPRIPFGIGAVLLLFLPRDYFVGSFAHDSFVAQVVSEMFAVAMWWALVVWDTRPSRGPLLVFALAGMGVFLTWPVWIGPLVLAIAALVVTRAGLSLGERAQTIAIACGPIAGVAVVYVAGRLAWMGMVGASAAVRDRSLEGFGWPFLVLAAAGAIVGLLTRRARATVIVLAAIAVQAAALLWLARMNRADTPYMAYKMLYLALYPQAALAALAIAMLWRAGDRAMSRGTTRQLGRVTGALDNQTKVWSHLRAPWIALVLASVLVVRSALAVPRPTPVVSDSLSLAGHWARRHVNPGCVDYVVRDGTTAYWLHVAVLGNPRASDRAGDHFDPRASIGRLVMPRGLPFAIVEEVDALPADARVNIDELARFGRAAVVKRRGPPAC